MFQEAALLPWLTAGRNVELPLRLAGVGRSERRGAGTRAALSGPSRGAGGEAARTSSPAACASASRWPGRSPPPPGPAVPGPPRCEPGVLLMDEPFGALDAITRDFLQAELLRVWEATGTTILFVTHDVRESVRLAERVVLLSSRPGRVVREWGTVSADTDAEELHEPDHDRAARGDLRPWPLTRGDAHRGARGPRRRRVDRRRAGPRRPRHPDREAGPVVAPVPDRRRAADRRGGRVHRPLADPVGLGDPAGVQAALPGGRVRSDRCGVRRAGRRSRSSGPRSAAPCWASSSP